MLLGLSQAELAEKTGGQVSVYTIQSLEQGRLKNPSLRTIEALGLALGLPFLLPEFSPVELKRRLHEHGRKRQP